MANLNKIFRQAQKMQRDVEEAQQQLRKEEISFAKNGVAIVMRGDFSIKSFKLDEDLLTADNKEMLEDILQVTVNEAVKQIRGLTESKLSGVTGGLGGLTGLI